MLNLQPIETCKPVEGKRYLIWHDHDADPYLESWEGIPAEIRNASTGDDIPQEYRELLSNPPSNRLTIYASHHEGSRDIIKEAGFLVAEFGGAYHEDVSGEGWGPFINIPDWWWLVSSEFEIPVNPTHWCELPEML